MNIFFKAKKIKVKATPQEMIETYAQVICLKTYLSRDELDLEEIEDMRETLLRSQIIQDDKYHEFAKWLKKFKPSKNMDLTIIEKTARNMKL